jgi:hypothetical protein
MAGVRVGVSLKNPVSDGKPLISSWKGVGWEPQVSGRLRKEVNAMMKIAMALAALALVVSGPSYAGHHDPPPEHVNCWHAPNPTLCWHFHHHLAA